ncbi:MAG TPA: hypothetical protein VHU84_19585 [Lacipirellulaceae bacterium]|nr:hypothetical protein [Lacipirellulaceae bacterium]
MQTPCAVAVRPEGGQPFEVFVAERGAGRIVRVVANHRDSSNEAITQFPRNSSDQNTPDSPGLQSFCFLDHSRLVAAGGGEDGKPFVRLYELQDLADPLKFDESKYPADLLASDASRKDGVASFHDMARTRANDRVTDNLLLASVGKGGPGGLWKVPIRANTLGDIMPVESTASKDDSQPVGGVAVGVTGTLSVATTAQISGNKNAVIRFLNPINGRALLEIPTDLKNIVGLAYSPSSGDLFVANFDFSDKSASGIYRIDDDSEVGKPACHVTKVAAVPRPTSLTVAADGTLYVTALGESGNGNHSGELLQLTVK